jgi:hypothetical protein
MQVFELYNVLKLRNMGFFFIRINFKEIGLLFVLINIRHIDTFMLPSKRKRIYGLCIYIPGYIVQVVSDCCLMPTQHFFSYHGKEKLIFNEMKMKSALY